MTIIHVEPVERDPLLPASAAGTMASLMASMAADVAELEDARDRLPEGSELRSLFDLAIHPLREHVAARLGRVGAEPR
jgi:hypothetical protein